MAILSERTMDWGRLGTDGKEWLLTEMAEAIEKLTEANHASATKIESLTLRIEELEAQLTALAPPKSAGPVIPVREQLAWVEYTPCVRWECKTRFGWYYYWEDGHYMLPDTSRVGSTPLSTNSITARIICQSDYDTRMGIDQCQI